MNCFQNPELGIYSSDANECTLTDIEVAADVNQELVFPNPITDKLTLLSDSKTVEVYNLQGLLEHSQVHNGIPIDLYNLVPGIYFLKTDYGVHKIIKQ